jgi:hypothetical protein
MNRRSFLSTLAAVQCFVHGHRWRYYEVDHRWTCDGCEKTITPVNANDRGWPPMPMKLPPPPHMPPRPRVPQ